jgi:hypothetical protein
MPLVDKGEARSGFIVQKTTEGTVEKVLDELNESTLDNVGPWTGYKRISLRLRFQLEVFICLAFKESKLC